MRRRGRWGTRKLSDFRPLLCTVSIDFEIEYHCGMKMKFMKALLSSVLFVIFFSADPLQAQTTRYCSDPSMIFNGEILYENDRPWSEFVVDPEFESSILNKERHISTGIETNPLYDTVLRIKPIFNYYCIPGWDEGKVEKVTADMLPEKVSIKANLIAGKKKDLIKTQQEFSRTKEQDERGRFIYEWKIKAWPNGLAPAFNLENLIGAVKNAEPVNFELFSDNKEKKIIIPAHFSLCVPLWGSGQNKMIYARGDSKQSFTSSLFRSVNFPVTELYNFAESIRTNGFEKIDPYKKYSQPENGMHFSHLIDLGMYNSTDFFNKTARDLKVFGGARFIFQEYEKIFSRMNDNISFCGNGLKVFLAKGMALDDRLGFSSVSNDKPLNTINIDYLKKKSEGTNPDIILPILVIHEISHSFARLNDEYVYPTFPNDSTFRFLKGIFKNCSDKPKEDYKKQNVLYGEITNNGCTTIDSYRPSDSSIMNLLDNSASAFNVVSCGYIIATIKGGKASDYWEECMNLDTLKPERKVSTGALDDGAFLDQVGDLVKEKGLAQVTSAGEEIDSNRGYIIAEDIDSNGKFSGDIYFDGGTELEIPKINYISPTPTQTPSMQILGPGLLRTLINNTKKATQQSISRFVSLMSGSEKSSPPTVPPVIFGSLAPSPSISSTTTPKPTIKTSPSLSSTTSTSPSPVLMVRPSTSPTVRPSVIQTPISSIRTTPTPSIKVTPTPTITPTPTPTPTITITPTPTISSTPTVVITPTPTTAPTPTASLFSSPASTTSPSPTSSPSSSPSASPSAFFGQNSLASVFESITKWLGWGK